MTKVIYKRSNTGAILEWFQEINETGDGYRSVSGQQGGAKIRPEWTICEPKNVGRSNETTPQQQCILEVEANYTKKLAQGGYHEKIEDIDKAKFLKPMLAETYADPKKPKKHVTSIAFKTGIVYSQPKLDGMRCVMDASGMTSRYGKPIVSSPHIVEALASFFQRNPDVIFDGELYADKLAEDFQKIMSLAKQTKPTQEDLNLSRQFLQYHIYDIPSVEGTFSQRYAALRELFETNIELNTPGSFFRLVPTEKVRDTAHLDELNDSYVEAMLEGQIVRLDNDVYENKRTWQLQKRKIFVTEEYTIIGIDPGKGNRAKIAAKVHFRMPSGVESSASIRGGWKYCADLLAEADQYIGGDCTIRFIRLTNDGKPYPAVCVAAFKGKRDM